MSLVPVEEKVLWIAIDAVYDAVQQSIKLSDNLTPAEEKNDEAMNSEDLGDKLAVLGSMMSAINTSEVITRLTLIVQKV